MDGVIRFAIIGAGAVAQSYAEAFSHCTSARLVAVCDVHLKSARSLAESHRCAAYQSYQEMLEDLTIDAVVVCTPPNTHKDISLHLLERTIHVLCEKPLATDAADAYAMLEAAKKAGVRLTMGSKFRYVDDVIRAKEVVDSGVLGEVILFENSFTSRVKMAGRWNSDPAISGGGVLIDNGSHSVDLIRYFLGPIDEIHVVEGKRHQALRVEDTVRIFVRSLSGIMGNIDLSWSINKELESYINIYGTQGALSLGWKESKYRLYDGRDWIVFGNGYNKVLAFRNQLENFARGILAKERLLITATDAIASVEVIEAAYMSLGRQNWIKVVNGRRNGDSRAPVAAAVAAT
jgi:predicted dehydrogenase